MDRNEPTGELQQLRQEVQELLRRAGELARRVEALESAPPAWEAKPEPAAPEPIPPIASTPPAEEPAVLETVPPKSRRPVFIPPPPTASPTAHPTAPPAEPVAARVQAKPFAAAPKRDWEVFLGSYVGPRIGIFVLATAAVLFLVWAAREWGPPVRIAIGYGVTAVLLVLGRLTEKKYPDYARVLYSGGFVLSYFVTYAAHYIPAARVIDNPVIALRLLALVVGAWAVAAQYRRSRTMAVLVLLMAHYTIFLSGPGPYSAFVIILLSLAGAFFLLWNRWYAIAAVGLAGSYVNQALWMINNAGSTQQVDFWISLAFLAGHFSIFALADLFAREDVRRQAVRPWFRNAFVTFNSVAFLALATALVARFAFTRGHQDILLFSFAGVLLALGLGYLRVQAGDPLYNAYLTKAVAVATLGLAVRYSGTSLSAWLAVESVVLLVSARRSGLVVTRLLALAVGVLALLHGLFTAQALGPIAYAAPDYGPRVIRAALTVLSLLGAALLYERTNWDLRSPRGSRFSPDTRAMLWDLGLVSEPPEPGRQRTLDGLFIPYAYALSAGILYLAFAWDLLQPGHRTPAPALAALVLGIAAAALAAKPYGLVSVVLVAAGLAFGAQEFYFAALQRQPLIPVPLAIVCLQALAITALFSEKALGHKRSGLAFHQAGPYFLYAVPGFLLGLHLVRELDGPALAAGLLTAGVIVAVATLWLHPRALAGVSAGLTVWALCAYAVAKVPEETAWIPWEYAGWALVLVPLLIDRFYRRVVRRVDAGFAWALLPVSGCAVLWYLIGRLPEGWLYFAVVLCGFAYLGYALAFRSAPGAAVSLVLAVIGSVAVFAHTYTIRAPLDTAPLVLGYGAAAVYWIVAERLQGAATRRWPGTVQSSFGAVAVATATLLLVLMLGRVPAIREHWLTASWAVLAFFIFGLAIAFREKPYRYAALAVIGLALGRAYVIDAFRLTGLTRVAAFAVLSLVLLLVGYGYVKALDYLRSRDEDKTAPPPGEPQP